MAKFDAVAQFRHFPYNENPTRALNTTALIKCCLQFTLLTLLTGAKNSHMLMMVQGRLMQARFIEIHGVSQKKK